MKTLFRLRYWVGGMLVVIVLISFVTYKQQRAAQEYKRHRAEYCSALIATEEQKKSCIEERASAQGYLPWGYELFRWPDGITALAIIVTGFFIGWQALETRKAAEATLKQTSHLVASERAWVMVEVKFPIGAGPLSFSGGINDGSTITDCEIIVKNAGRTPAWVYEQVVQMAVSKLPPIPEFDETSKTNIGVYPVAQHQPATIWKPFIEAKGLPDLDGQPYIFGVVRYRDSFSHFRELISDM